MKRTTMVPVSAAIGLAVTALALASCGRSSAPVALQQGKAPSATALDGSPTPITDPPDEPMEPGAGQAVVVLNDGVSATSFLSRHSLTEIEATTIGTRTFHLVAGGEGTTTKTLLEDLGHDFEVAQAFKNDPIATPEFEGQPMSFDDGGGIVGRNGYPDPELAQRLMLPMAHLYTKGSGIKVAILDTGIDRTHPALRTQTLILGYNFAQLPHANGADDTHDGIDNDGDGYVDEAWGHGTHVAGIVHMVAPLSSMIVIKVLDDEGWGTCFGVASGIANAIQLGAKVINLSMGLTAHDPMIKYAVEYAQSRGVGVVASAGNQGSPDVQYPAGYDEVYSVTAVDKDDHLAKFANFNPTVDGSAPGVDVISTFPVASALGPYAAGDGTSMAAPFVSATAVLVLALHRELTGHAAVSYALDYAIPIDDLNAAVIAGQIGRGRINVGRAVHHVQVVEE